MDESRDGESVKTTLRFPRALHVRVAALATQEHRSFQGQVLTLLEEALAQREREDPRQA